MECILERPPCGNPSFTASLLGAIYRTLDSPVAPETKATGPTTCTDHVRANPKPHQSEQKKKPQSDLRWSTNKKQVQFSCDAPPYQSKIAKTNKTCGNPPLLAPKAPPQEKKKKRNSNPIRRWREKKVHADSSTGKNSPSPIGNLIKSIFSTKSSKKKKKQQKTATEVQPILEKMSVPMPEPEPVLMHKVVRFRESLQSRDLDMNHDMDTDAEAVKVLVNDVLRGTEIRNREEVEEGSEESSDLFELENMTDIGSDEVPLFATTGIVSSQTAAYCT